MKNGIGSHQSANMLKDEWLTPKYITDDLGPFDLDPCSPIIRPWETAKKYHTIEDNGLLQDWGGFVWCNPPYGRSAGVWLDRMSLYNNGIALVFARTETKMFQQYVWNNASCLLFIYDRLYFHHVDGSRAIANSGAPSVLIGYGSKAFERLKNSSIKGKFISIQT